MDMISEVIRKREEIMDTFTPNKGFDKAFQIITDELKREAVDKKIRTLRAGSIYDKRAAEYYAKHGTAGEF